MDLDYEEVKATRKLNGADRESNIEEDIKILERFKNNEMQRDKLERDNRCGAWKIGDIYKHLELNTAINHILAERESDKKRIKELEEENRIFALEGSRVALKLHIEENYIPKQKVKEIILKIINYKIPRAVNNGYYYDYFVKQEYKEDFVKLFNKLLEDK